jgi:hypothetical protein
MSYLAVDFRFILFKFPVSMSLSAEASGGTLGSSNSQALTTPSAVELSLTDFLCKRNKGYS